MVAIAKGEYAKHRGVSAAMVTKWIKARRLALTPDGKRVLVEESDRLLAGSLAPDRGGKGGKSDREDVPVQSVSSGPSFAQVRTAREAFAVKNAEIEYRKRVGELVEWSAVERALGAALGPILTRMEAQASRLASRLAAEGDVRAVTKMLDTDNQVSRQELADAMKLILAGRGQTRQ